jgi:hypothetical protein
MARLTESRGNRKALALALIQLSENARYRALYALEQLQADERAGWAPRKPRVKGAGSELVVINSQGRAMRATNDPQLAESLADNYPGRQILDMTHMPRGERYILSNVLRSNPVGKTIAQIPAIPPRAIPSKPIDPEVRAEQKRAELERDIRAEVARLELEDEKAKMVTRAALEAATIGGWSAATDLIFEINLLLYTNVEDMDTGTIIEFETAKEAAEYSHLMNQSSDGIRRNKRGEPLGYRYKVVKP